MLWPPFRSRSGRRCRRRCPAGLTHPAGPSGPGPTPPQAALDLQLGFGWVCFVAQTQVFRVVPALGPATPVDGLVGVLDDVELVDDLRGVGQVFADASGEFQAHVARHQTHPVWVAVAVHEILHEPFDGMRVLARHHADHVALRLVGDHSDAVAAFAAGPVDAYRLHARVVPVRACLVHVMSDEPPQAGVVLADLRHNVRTGWLFASSTTIASNRSMNLLPRRAHGIVTALMSCLGHVTRAARPRG